MAMCFYNSERQCNDSCPFYVDWINGQRKKYDNMFCRKAYYEIHGNIETCHDKTTDDLEAVQQELRELKLYLANKQAEDIKKAEEAERLRLKNERAELMKSIRDIIKNQNDGGQTNV